MSNPLFPSQHPGSRTSGPGLQALASLGQISRAAVPASSPPQALAGDANDGMRQRTEEALRKLGVKEKHIRIALDRVADSNESLTTVMGDFGFVTGEKVAQVLSLVHNLPYFRDSDVAGLDAAALSQITLKTFEGFAPVGFDPTTKDLTVVIPTFGLVNEVKNRFRDYRVHFKFASEVTVNAVYKRYFARSREALEHAVQGYMKGLRNEEANLRNSITASGSEGSLRSVWRALVRHACYAGASDIYLTSTPTRGVVMMKISGQLDLVRSVDLKLFNGLMQRLVQDDGKPEDVKKAPRDTRLKFEDEEDKRELADILDRFGFRVSLTETRGRLKAVIRLNDRQGAAASVESLGFDKKTLDTLKRLTDSASGLIIMTGPTGSGKTTTLYALLNHVDPVERSVQTVENPIELTSPLWLQNETVQVKDSSEEGNQFKLWLKALLRSAPDVILVGEIRDVEVAKMALDASNTGHLVFSTLHTNSASLAIPRLKLLEVDMPTLASVLLAVVGQRLVRTLCTSCRQAEDRPETEALVKGWLARVKASESDLPLGKLYKRGPGCGSCKYTGISGRRVIYEVLENTPVVRGLIEDNAKPTVIEKEIPKGYSLYDCGLRMVNEGVTSIDEVRRVVNQSAG